MARHWLARLGLAGLALGLSLTFGWRLPAVAEPQSQEAFRGVLVKYDELAEKETDIDRLRALGAERGRELANLLGKDLRFEAWQLVLSGAEPTPLGGLFVRLLDPQLLTFQAVRPTYWNSGPGAILRQAEISAKSPLRASIALLKREAAITLSGHFFPDEQGGPFFESAHGSFEALSIERSKFRMPYFSIHIEAIDEQFPDRRFP